MRMSQLFSPWYSAEFRRKARHAPHRRMRERVTGCKTCDMADIMSVRGKECIEMVDLVENCDDITIIMLAA